MNNNPFATEPFSCVNEYHHDVGLQFYANHSDRDPYFSQTVLSGGCMATDQFKGARFWVSIVPLDTEIDTRKIEIAPAGAQLFVRAAADGTITYEIKSVGA